MRRQPRRLALVVDEHAGGRVVRGTAMGAVVAAPPYNGFRLGLPVFSLIATMAATVAAGALAVPVPTSSAARQSSRPSWAGRVRRLRLTASPGRRQTTSKIVAATAHIMPSVPRWPVSQSASVSTATMAAVAVLRDVLARRSERDGGRLV